MLPWSGPIFDQVWLVLNQTPNILNDADFQHGAKWMAGAATVVAAIKAFLLTGEMSWATTRFVAGCVWAVLRWDAEQVASGARAVWRWLRPEYDPLCRQILAALAGPDVVRMQAGIAAPRVAVFLEDLMSDGANFQIIKPAGTIWVDGHGINSYLKPREVRAIYRAADKVCRKLALREKSQAKADGEAMKELLTQQLRHAAGMPNDYLAGGLNREAPESEAVKAWQSRLHRLETAAGV